MAFQPSAISIIEQAAATGDFVLTEDVGVANGVAGLDANGDIVATAIHRVDTAANLAAITLKNGEIAIASDTNDILRGNGSTLGGVLVQGGIRAYSVGPVELTSTARQNISSVSCVPGVYRWWGVAGFSGDSDNISNFAFATGSTTATLSSTQAAEIGSYWGTFSWRETKGTWFEAPTVLDWFPVSQATFGLFTATPPTLTLDSGRCNFDYYLNVASSHTRDFAIRLRTTKVGTPTILGAYRLFVQRVA